MSTPHRNSGACCPDPAVERADWVPPTPRRWSIWEIPGNLQCSIIGTCLSHEDLLAIARRLELVIKADATAYDVHSYFVNEAGRSSPAAHMIQKQLDRRFEGLVRRIGRLQTERELADFWAEAFASGQVPGAYWALVTCGRLSDELRKRAFGDVHMLSHVLGRTTHASASRASELASRVEELEARLARETRRQQEALAARDTRIERLEAELAALRRPNRLAPRQQPAHAAAVDRAGALVVRRERALVSARQRARAAEGEADRLRTRLRQLASTMPARLREAARLPSPCPGAEACKFDVPQSRVLYLGGRARAIERLRTIAADANAELYHHDGGLEQTVDQIDGLVSRCDAVFCPVDCISHGACERAKALCRKLAKPFVPLRSSGASTFRRALQDLHRIQ